MAESRRQTQVALTRSLPGSLSPQYCFMDLPAEIRLKIYHYVFYSVEIQAYTCTWLRLLGLHPTAKHDHEPVTIHRRSLQRLLSLLSTNKVIRAEALPIVFDTVHLYVSTGACLEGLAPYLAASASHWLFKVKTVTWQMSFAEDSVHGVVDLDKTLFGSEMIACLEIDVQGPKFKISTSTYIHYDVYDHAWTKSKTGPVCEELEIAIRAAKKVRILMPQWESNNNHAIIVPQRSSIPCTTTHSSKYGTIVASARAR